MFGAKCAIETLQQAGWSVIDQVYQAEDELVYHANKVGQCSFRMHDGQLVAAVRIKAVNSAARSLLQESHTTASASGAQPAATQVSVQSVPKQRAIAQREALGLPALPATPRRTDKRGVENTEHTGLTPEVQRQKTGEQPTS
eukprot:6472888-Amphidinium_carterae.2